MILFYFPIAQNTVNKTVSDFFRDVNAFFMNVHIFYYFSIYWSDTSLMWLIVPSEAKNIIWWTSINQAANR